MGRKGKDKGGLPPERIGSTLDSFLEQEGIRDPSLQQAMADAAKEAEERGGIAMVLTADELAKVLETPVENVATAPTEECTAHVADEQGRQCVRCGKPFELLHDGQRKLAIMRRDVPPEVFDAVMARGEDVVTMTPCWLVRLSELWHDRLVQLAKRNNMTPEQYAEHLIKRQWIASGGGRG